MYTRVAEKLGDQPLMDDYQREILEKALKFYEWFALPQSPDPQVRLEAARAGMRVGGIRSRLGQTVAAEQADRQALEILRRLVADQPAEPTYREALAEAHRVLGDVLRTEERRPECEREIKEAAALWDALAQEQPEIAEYQLKLANANGSLGLQYQIEGRVEEAKAAFGEALKLAEALAREHPEASDCRESLATILHAFARLQRYNLNDPAGSTASEQRAVAIEEKLAQDHPELTKYQLRLAAGLSTLGRTSVWRGGDLGRFREAEVLTKRSIDILEKLAAEHPDDMRIAETLGNTYLLLKQILDQRGDNQSAQEWSSRSIQVLRSLAHRDPRNLWAGRNQLAALLAERAETRMRLGRLTEALPDFKEAAELAHSIGSRDEELYRAFHALTKTRLGDLSELALRREEIGATVNAGAGVGFSVYGYTMLFYDAACAHAALAQLALQDQQSLPAERRRLADRELRRALELLDKAHATGEFKGWFRLDAVRSERLLDALRAHPEFQRLMMDLEFPDNPFGQ